MFKKLLVPVIGSPTARPQTQAAGLIGMGSRGRSGGP